MWNELEEFLQEKKQSLLDELEAVYRAPLDEEDIEDFEIKYDVILPETLRDAYMEYNGMSDFPPHFPSMILSLNHVEKMMDEMSGVMVQDTNMEEEFEWNDAWIPFAIFGTGDLLCLDLSIKPDEDDEDGWDEIPEGMDKNGMVFVWNQEGNLVEVVASDIDDWFEGWLEEIEESIKKKG